MRAARSCFQRRRRAEKRATSAGIMPPAFGVHRSFSLLCSAASSCRSRGRPTFSIASREASRRRFAPRLPALPVRRKKAVSFLKTLIASGPRPNRQVPAWKTISVRFETSASAPLTFSIEQGQRGRPDLRSQLTLDSKTGEVVRSENVCQLQSRPPAPQLGALRSHRRSGWRARANHRCARLCWRCLAGLHGFCPGVAPLPGTETPEPCHARFGRSGGPRLE